MPQAVTPERGRRPGIDGEGQAGKTVGNAIFLSDSSDIVARKVRAMYTDPLKATVADAGHLDGHVPCAYLEAFAFDKQHIEELKRRYEAGGLGDTEIKNHLVEVLEDVLAPIRACRAEFAEDPSEVLRMLQSGTKRTREVAAGVLDDPHRLDVFVRAEPTILPEALADIDEIADFRSTAPHDRPTVLTPRASAAPVPDRVS